MQNNCLIIYNNIRKNRDENVEMDDGNKEDWEDQDRRNL